LKDHREDIELLAEHFLREIETREKAGVQHWDPKALELLRAHVWPGNVRELRNIVHRAYILTEGSTIGARTVRGLLPDKLGEESEPKKKARPQRRTPSRAARR